MLRAPLRAWCTADDQPGSGVTSDDPFPAEQLAGFLRRAAEPGLDEGLALSSPSLARTLATVRSGKPIKAAALRRAATALSRYQLRAASRATPFGLLAGVSLLRFGERTDVDVGTAHRKVVTADGEWLTSVLTDWERRPEVLRRLRVVANNLVTTKGDRVVLPSMPDADVGERSLRDTPVVRAALRLARRPIMCAQLGAGVIAEFSTAPEDKIVELLGQLVDLGFLLTELRPSVHSGDPLGHALDLLRPVAVELPETVRREIAELTAIQRDLARYAETAVGAGQAELAIVTRRMMKLRPAGNLLNTTVTLDAAGTVHHAVGAELARAATVLWRLAPDTTPPWLRSYHSAFIHRYGLDRLVPVADLLDSERGLGTPSGYTTPSAAPDPADGEARYELLAALAMGTPPGQEATLDDATLDRLCPETPDGPPQTSMDLYAELIAADAAAVDRGDFRIVLNPWAGSQAAGAMFARFAHALGADDLVTRMTQESGPDEPRPVDLAFQPHSSRFLNLVAPGLKLGEHVVVGAFHDPDLPTAVPLDDLLVGTDGRNLRVISRSRQQIMRIKRHHMLNPAVSTPHVARLLSDISAMGQRAPRPWTWGALSAAPFLPRVRYGRVVLSAATWRIADPMLTDRDVPWPVWRKQLASWRERWRVPSAVRLGVADQRIRLDLDRDWHQWMLREHMLAEGRAVLREDASRVGPSGWITGEHQPVTAELVASLHASPEHRERVRSRPNTAWMDAAWRRTEPHLPGGPWLYAKLYLGTERQDEFIAGPLADLASRLPAEVDRWFLVRHADPDPHLRVRFHGDPAALGGKLLTDLRDWAGDLVASGEIRDVALATYEPETHRYGGPTALDAAEAVFHADTLAAMAQLAEGTTFLLPAANMADIAWHLLSGVPGEDIAEWMRRHLVKDEDDHRAFRDHRSDVLRLIPMRVLDPSGEDTAPPGLPMPDAIWRDRARALRRYGSVLHRLEIEQRRDDIVATALSGLLHTHHNRLAGIDRDNERRALAVMRGAVIAHDSRRRSAW